MKKFPLSTSAERAAGVAFTAAMLLVFGLLLYALRANTSMLLVCGLGVALIGLLLIIYCVSVVKASVTVDSEKKLLHVSGVKNYTVDLKDATLLQTFARKNGQTTVRLLVFSDQEDEIVASVPTMYTFRQGIWADPVAKEIAAELYLSAGTVRNYISTILEKLNVGNRIEAIARFKEKGWNK